MQPPLTTLALLPLVSLAATLTTRIFIQPIHESELEPSLLSEIEYDPADSASTSPISAEIVFYEPPALPKDVALVRIGVYDATTKRWTSSTTITSVASFDKGFAPAIQLTATEAGDVIGASVRGVKIDAGATRDFGPRAQVIAGTRGKEVDLNKPVVLSPEGKNVVPEEKSLFQKYWWVLGLVSFLILTGGGGGGGDGK